MERGRAAYDFQAGQLAEVVERSLDVYRHRIEREGFWLVTKIDTELPPTADRRERDDAGCCSTCWRTPSSTACQSTCPARSASILLAWEMILRLVVADQGPGIARDEPKKIFDRFYRTRGARGTNVRGSGIGLSLVKHIVEAHGGRVTVESEPGKGAASSSSIRAAQKTSSRDAA